MTRNNALIFNILAALAIGNIAYGMLTQLIPLAMNEEGDSKFLIGQNVMAGQAGVLLSGLTLAWLRQHFKSHLLVMGCLVLAFVGFSLFPFTTPVYSWFLIRFLIGITGATIYTTGESWLQANTDDHARGRVMGIYMTCQSFAFAFGPFFIPWTGVAGWQPWAFCFVPVAIALVLMQRVKVEEVATGQAPAGLWQTLRSGAFVFLAVGVVTFFDSFMLTFFDLFAKGNGYSDGAASTLLSFGIASCMVMFFPIGWLADHWSRRGTLAVCYGVALACALLLGLAIGTWAVWPLILVLRGTAFGGYLVAYALLGEKFKGTAMVAAASINSLLWGMAGIIGPPFAGFVFDRFGIWLLPWFLAACFVPVLAVMAIARARMPQAS
ncbi:MAG: MFS transporter [Alphaproteobacteria bacterium]|nr:MFS transporter [Alphaproteobacteria bacterium]